jgi:hypothetical protein
LISKRIFHRKAAIDEAVADAVWLFPRAEQRHLLSAREDENTSGGGTGSTSGTTKIGREYDINPNDLRPSGPVRNDVCHSGDSKCSVGSGG